MFVPAQGTVRNSYCIEKAVESTAPLYRGVLLLISKRKNCEKRAAEASPSFFRSLIEGARRSQRRELRRLVPVYVVVTGYAIRCWESIC